MRVAQILPFPDIIKLFLQKGI